MSTSYDASRGRAILSTIRMRFAPQVQPIKDTAIESIIENILYTSASQAGLSIEEMQSVFSSESLAGCIIAAG